MSYPDILYGNIKVPLIFEALVNTNEMRRLNGISQDVLPSHCVPYPTASRFEHCLGAFHLARKVTKSFFIGRRPTTESTRKTKLLQISALLHDAGNPAFSHVSEPFLRQLCKRDGESFLEELLTGTESEKIINRLGFGLKEIVRMVTGQAEPFSAVLNGSIDIDNLDNVARYWAVSHNAEQLYNPEFIASCFDFTNSRWILNGVCLEEVEKWQAARAAVYGTIYGNPHLNIAMMIYRALGIAFAAGQIKESFFRLIDYDALTYLISCKNYDVAALATRVLQGKWHQEFFFEETFEPSENLKCLLKHWDIRCKLADFICQKCGFPKTAICIYLGQGKDKRQITLQFQTQKGLQFLANQAAKQAYRLKAYIDPEFWDQKEKAIEVVKKLKLF